MKGPASPLTGDSYVSSFTGDLNKSSYDHLQMALCGSVPLVSAEELVIRWIETRTKRELELYPVVYKMMMDIVDEVFSASFIRPGVTTTADV